jgi:hypothetical protein
VSEPARRTKQSQRAAYEPRAVDGLTVASEFFGQLDLKEIGNAEIEDFILSQKDVSDKTRQNRKANLHAFFVWLVKRRVIRKDPTLCTNSAPPKNKSRFL